MWFLSSWLLAFSTASGYATETRLYAIPPGISADSANRLTIDNLGLVEPMGILAPDGSSLDDHDLDKRLQANPQALPSSGFWSVSGSKPVPLIVFTIDGPANMRLKPRDRVIGSWPDGEPVLALKSAGEWRLIANTKGHYAWTNIKNLKKVPHGKVLLNPASAMAKGYPKSLLSWLSDSVDEKIIELKAAVDSKDKSKILSARRRLCPADFSEAEQDGLLPEEKMSNTRTKLAELCDAVSTFRPVKKVRLKVSQCSCLVTQMGDVDPKEVRSTGEFPPKTSSGHFECTRGRFYVVCSNQEVCGEGCAPGSLACPVSCLDLN